MGRPFTAAVFAAMLTLSACGSSGGPGGTASAGHHRGEATITIKDFGYTGDLTVHPGEDVTVVNDDSVTHSLTDRAAGRFDTGGITPDGGTKTFVAPTKPGSYPFVCTFHPEMSGVLTVSG